MIRYCSHPFCNNRVQLLDRCSRHRKPRKKLSEHERQQIIEELTEVPDEFEGIVNRREQERERLKEAVESSRFQRKEEP